MTLVTRSATALAVAALTFALAGCGEEGDAADDAAPAQSDSATETAAPADPQSEAADGGEEDGGACPAVNQAGLDLFTTDQVVEAPAEGAVYGDGSTVQWTFAAPIEGTPDVDMYYINDDGDAIAMTGIFLDDYGNNTWGSNLNVFWSDADGMPGLMVLGLTHDAAVADDGTLSGTHEEVGIYCVSYKVVE